MLKKMVKMDHAAPIVCNEVVLDGLAVNGDNKESEANKSFGRVGGLTVATTTVFIIGEMAGSGVLALPHAIEGAGWMDLVVLVVCCFLSGFNGVQLGSCWTMMQERWPEYRGHIRYPYPAIAERAFGKPMRHVVSVCVDLTLFGGTTVFLLIAAQNVQSLFLQAGVTVSFCYWLPIMAAILIPASWLGTPKDFWPIAVGATCATALACLLITVNIGMDSHSLPSPTHSTPGFKSFFGAFGTILFSFGGASTFPTIQNDMRQPKDFTKAVVISYIAILSLYVPVSTAGYFVYGDSVASNILQSMSPGGIRATVELLITVHLLLACLIILNPISQHLEELCHVPHRFHWKRCVLRTCVILVVLFVTESIPHFGAILDLVGGSTVTFLTFIAPSMFFLKLAYQQGEWTDRRPALHIVVLNIEIMVIGVVGGIASTYAAISEIASPSTFIPPCYVNLTAASGL